MSFGSAKSLWGIFHTYLKPELTGSPSVAGSLGPVLSPLGFLMGSSPDSDAVKAAQSPEAEVQTSVLPLEVCVGLFSLSPLTLYTLDSNQASMVGFPKGVGLDIFSKTILILK